MTVPPLDSTPALPPGIDGQKISLMLVSIIGIVMELCLSNKDFTQRGGTISIMIFFNRAASTYLLTMMKTMP